MLCRGQGHAAGLMEAPTLRGNHKFTAKGKVGLG